MQKHFLRSLEWKGPVAGVNEMRRHYANYLRGLPGVKDYRQQLVTTQEPECILNVLDEVEKKYHGFEYETPAIYAGAAAQQTA